MRVRKSLLLVLIIMLFFVASEATAAAPVPPELAVNHESKQCAEFWGGDECVVCSLPEGWESLGGLWEAECPTDYATVEIKSTCWAAKITFCCSEGHSGAPGDCEDVVINKRAEQCAFVEDIGECPALPDGWGKHGEDCPYYDWADDVECLDKAGPGTSGGFGSVGVYEAIIVSVICMLLCLVPLGVLLIFVGVWLARRRSGQSAESAQR
jgi:hypothetical protein